jgi:two-component sensor histidine kinase
VIRAHGVGERLSIVIDGNPATLDLNRAVPFGLLLNELVSNVCKQTMLAGTRADAEIRLGRDQDTYFVLVSANGNEIAPSGQYDRSSQLGLKLVHLLAQQLGGDISLMPGNAGQVRLRFPVTEVEEEGIS